MEIWKDIKGYEGRYKISNYGNIFSVRKGINMKVSLHKKGYCKIKLYKNGINKSYWVHRLVLETFNEIKDMNKLQVNHKNEIKTDNNLSNLEWCTAKENINHGNHNKKLSIYRKSVKPNLKLAVICINTGEVFESISSAARFYGIKNKSGITKVIKGIQSYCGVYNGEKLEWMYYNKYIENQVAI